MGPRGLPLSRSEGNAARGGGGRGTLRFMLDEGPLNATLFLSFLQRLVRGARGKVFLGFGFAPI